jgi:hypothetical protein
MARLHSVLLAAVLLSCLVELQAYTFVPKEGGKRLSSRIWFTQGNGNTMYLPKSSPTTTGPKKTKTPGHQQPEQRRRHASLSNSVLASCDTLPSFPTAHGLLSPQTVMRMEKRTSKSQRSDELSQFLKTYRREGPMSCLPMLSDPQVLPHLTEALRDIA